MWLDISGDAFQVVLCNLINEISLKNIMRFITINKQRTGLSKISQSHIYFYWSFDKKIS